MSKIKKEELEVLHKQENAKVEIQNRIGLLQIEIHIVVSRTFRSSRRAKQN